MKEVKTIAKHMSKESVFESKMPRRIVRPKREEENRMEKIT
jgi:hypothetical protein